MRVLSVLIGSAAALAFLHDAAQAQSSCPQGTTYIGQWVEHTSDADITHIQCETTPSVSCSEAVQRRVAMLSALTQQAHVAEMNQKFLKEWEEMGKEGRDNLVKDSVGAIEDAVAAGTEVEAESYKDLMKEAAPLEKEILKPGFKKDLRALALLPSIYDEARPLKLLAATNAVAEKYGTLTNDAAWGAAKISMRKVLATRAAEHMKVTALMEKLPEKVREDLKDEPAANFEARLDIYGEIAKKVGERIGKYLTYMGPTTRVTKFVFDGIIDDIQISLSADHVDQADVNAGKFAQGTGLLQADYKVAVDNVRSACKQN